ncbi:MAG TPA: TSUP family transporter [Anaeromyxobacter sp.]|nr:TSUP family transporter [Anaeromyxobacter sp.]
MVEPGLGEIALLTLVALVAGTVDAIAGGGGLLTVPAILWAGLPPHLALGTNKGQSVFGSLAALARFVRGGLVDGRRCRWPLRSSRAAGSARTSRSAGATRSSGGSSWR